MQYVLKDFQEAVNVTRLANIHYFEFSKRFHGRPDSHPFRELVYIDNGRITVESDHYTGELCKDQVIIHKPNENHYLVCTDAKPPNVVVIGFECDCPELDQFAYAPTTLSQSMRLQLSEIIKEGNTVFILPHNIPYQEDMKKRSSFPFGADQMIRLQLELLLIRLIRSKTPEMPVVSQGSGDAPTYLQDIRQYIDENFCQNIRLEDLCVLFTTNRTTLCNQFRDAYGVTIIDYINQLRIRKAKSLLREEKHNATQIAFELGFNSLHYFSQTFKKYEGITPTEYRATIKARFEN